MNIQDGTADDGAANGTILAINLGSASLRAAVHNRDGHRCRSHRQLCRVR